MKNNEKVVMLDGQPFSEMMDSILKSALSNAPLHHLHAHGYDEGYVDGYEEALTMLINAINSGRIDVQCIANVYKGK